MRIGCSSYSFRESFERREVDLVSWFDLAVELGLDAVELLTGHFPSVSRRFLRDLKEKRDACRVEISALAVSNNFGHPDADERDRQCDDLVAWMHVAKALDVDILRTFTGHVVSSPPPVEGEGRERGHAEGLPQRYGASSSLVAGTNERGGRSDAPGPSPQPSPPHETAGARENGRAPEPEAAAKRWVYECYAKVVPVAERLGVTMAVENHGNLLNSADEMHKLLWHFGSSSLQFNPDPTNFLPRHAEAPESERGPIYDSLEKLARFTVHSHLKVRDFDAAGVPTNVDVPRLLAIYRKACFDGVLSMEYFGEGRAHEAIGKGAAYLRGRLEAEG
jgi:sugar phosphate isomerase/epimerase